MYLLSITCLPGIFVSTFCNNRDSIPTWLQHPSQLRIQMTSAGVRGRNRRATYKETVQKLLPLLLSVGFAHTPFKAKDSPAHDSSESFPLASRGHATNKDHQICGRFTQETGKAHPDHSTQLRTI